MTARNFPTQNDKFPSPQDYNPEYNSIKTKSTDPMYDYNNNIDLAVKIGLIKYTLTLLLQALLITQLISKNSAKLSILEKPNVITLSKVEAKLGLGNTN